MRPRPAEHLRDVQRALDGLPWGAPSWPSQLERPARSTGTGVEYEGDWSRRYPARLARAVILDNITRPAVRMIASPTLRGTERLDALEAPVIFASNHASHIDTPLLLACLPERFRHRTVVGAAADHFFDRRWKATVWSFAIGAIPIERQRVSRRSADLAAQLIEEGWNLVIFPEGGRTPDGWGQPFKGGAAYLAKRTGAPVVPVHVGGTRHILRKGGRRLRASPTCVTFGEPLRASEEDDARGLSARIESAVAVLADELRTDWWTAKRRAAMGETPRLGGPETSSWRRSWALGTRPAKRERAWPEEARQRGRR